MHITVLSAYNYIFQCFKVISIIVMPPSDFGMLENVQPITANYAIQAKVIKHCWVHTRPRANVLDFAEKVHRFNSRSGSNHTCA